MPGRRPVMEDKKWVTCDGQRCDPPAKDAGCKNKRRSKSANEAPIHGRLVRDWRLSVFSHHPRAPKQAKKEAFRSCKRQKRCRRHSASRPAAQMPTESDYED